MKRWTIIVFSTVATCALFFSPPTRAAAAPEDLDDQEIQLAVESEFLVDDAVPSHRIDVAIEKGTVTLAGSVDSLRAKQEATRAAESVKGVVAVINNIAVQPAGRPDSRIRADVTSALADDPVTESYEILVGLEEGVATLTGEVDSYTEKAVAADVAEGVKGVVEVDNQLTYDFVSDRLDDDIKADIEYRIETNAAIRSGLIDVSVDDGRVTLGGSVVSALQKTEAATAAWMVAGVKSVANQIDVEWWFDRDSVGGGGDWTDRDRAQAVANALQANPRVKSFHISVSVDDGVATLTGTVDNLQAKRAAASDANTVLGIWRVRNYLHVRPQAIRTDSDMADDIGDALRRNPYVDRYDITVSVYNGQAYLNGDVDSWYMKEQAEEAASGVRGVIDVRNNLHVDFSFNAKTDLEIAQDIESQLWWSPFVDSDDVNVEVHAGVATLTGTVADWGEFRVASENARQGGATTVINQTKIERD